MSIHIPNAKELSRFMETCGTELVEAIREARAFAESEKVRVAAYVKPIFDRYTFMEDRELLDGREPSVIDDPDAVGYAEYTPELGRYFEEVKAAHIENGNENGWNPYQIALARLKAAETNLVIAIFERLYKSAPIKSILAHNRLVALFVDGKEG